MLSTLNLTPQYQSPLLSTVKAFLKTNLIDLGSSINDILISLSCMMKNQDSDDMNKQLIKSSQVSLLKLLNKLLAEEQLKQKLQSTQISLDLILMNLYLKMRQKLAKKGHRRQISKQLIKRNLMEDLYPIRPRDSRSRSKMKSSLSIKFANTLDFMEFQKTQALMLEKFKEKLKYELFIPQYHFDIAFQYLNVDNHVYQIIKKLVNLHTKSEEGKEKQAILHAIRNIIPTSKPILQSIVRLLLFYHFICLNIEEYRSIIKEFERQEIFQLINKINYPRSELITSKILSAIYLILLKYNETAKIIAIAPKLIKLRRTIQTSQRKLQTQDHKRETLLFNLKYIQFLAKGQTDPYTLMNDVQQQLELINSQENTFTDLQIIKLYRAQLLKLKTVIQLQVEKDYYQDYKSEQKVLQIGKSQEKISKAIKQLKRRKSVNLFSLSISFEQNQSEMKGESQLHKVTENHDKKYRQVYNPAKNIQKFSKLSEGTNLKKGRKNTKSTINIEEIKAIPIPQQSSKTKALSKQVNTNSDLFSKLSNLYQMSIKNNFREEQRQPSQKERVEKMKKIETVYQNFSNLNKIVRQIPRKNLQKEFYKIRDLNVGHKWEIKEMTNMQIINFEAGLQKGSNQISSILNNKGCLSLQFVKVWLGAFYLVSIVIEVREFEFMLKVTLNRQTYNILLNRGSNLLCERYVTIWPTIRYLINKKLHRYSIFKKYQPLLLTKKMQEISLIQLQSEIYLQKFGFISKQEIEEINICLDSVFKIILISKHYYANSFHPWLVKINQQLPLPYLIPLERHSGQIMKLNMLSQIYLLTNPKVILAQFLSADSDKYSLVKISSARQKLVNIIKNREQMQVTIQIIGLIPSSSKIAHKITVLWTQLQRNLVIYEYFKRYIIQILSCQSKNKYFANKLIRFFSKRIVVKYHPIFKSQCKFIKEPIFSKTIEPLYSSLDQDYQRHRLQTIQRYCHEAVPINKKQENNPQVTFLSSKVKQRQSLARLKSKKYLQKRQIWRQQKRIRNKDYLIIISLAQQRISEEWIAQFSVINRKTRAKYILILNHLDLFNIYANELSVMIEESRLTLQDQESNIKSQIRKQKQILLSKLINSTSFYYQHHVQKICIQKDGKNYHYNFQRQVRTEKQLANRRENRSKNIVLIRPLLQQFTIYCHLRIVKTIKLGNRFGFLTLKQNLIEDQFFWEITLQFPRRQTHYTYHMKQENMIFYISDHYKKKYRKQQTSKKLDYSISFPSFSRANQSFSLSFEQTSRQESINYKERILNLISMGFMRVQMRDDTFILFVFEDEYVLRERIISHYDPINLSLYNVWVSDNTIEVQIYRQQSSLIQNSQSRSSQFLNAFKQDVIGKIEFSLAERFYLMQNKQIGNSKEWQGSNLKRISSFYFYYVKQQLYKQNKLRDTKTQNSQVVINYL